MGRAFSACRAVAIGRGGGSGVGVLVAVGMGVMIGVHLGRHGGRFVGGAAAMAGTCLEASFREQADNTSTSRSRAADVVRKEVR